MEHEQQQPMSDERLAEIHHIVDTVNFFYGSRLARELLAEVERLRAREAALVAVVRVVAETGTDFDMNTGNSWLLFPGLYTAEQCREQARALLASERSGGDGACDR